MANILSMDRTPFIKLGEDIEKTWEKVNYQYDAFAGIAFEALKEVSFTQEFNLSEVVQWMLDGAPDV